MTVLSRFFFFTALSFTQISLASTQLVDNACSTALSEQHLLQSTHSASQADFKADPSLRFLGFDIIDKQGEPHLRARFAASQLEFAYFDVYTEHSYLHCGTFMPERQQSDRQAWAADLPVREALARLQDSNTLGIWVNSERRVDGKPQSFVTDLSYSRTALLKLLQHHDATRLPYALKMQHPSDLNQASADNDIVYCLNSRFGKCDYSHPGYGEPGHLILPIKGEVVLDGYISRLLFKEDVEQDGLSVAATDFGVWNWDNPVYELGALRGNAKAFLAPFFTLSYQSATDSEQIQTKIAWDIPSQYGAFLNRNTYARDYETYWLMSFAFEHNPLGSPEQAKQLGYAEDHYQRQTQTSFIALTGLNEAKQGAFKLAPLRVTFP
ncbi:hypothetical protein CWB99_09000 [Pseudoalteromonas rubra]|uniref:Uncharacterized protein n=1 Tax=Pseudoalteromonas rubra TaxID=43658 RepID=A0A5S3WPG7_9GAMM|nr:hypothetical protein [Pseudoalteromonas rubra]TMP29326.1 hypothetical protein CWB99_09000 [Pseudoalteromonas rubra]TMP34069.1 hypothetical protein CWC00_09240 [Pseudoalteromonas rubra]